MLQKDGINLNLETYKSHSTPLTYASQIDMVYALYNHGAQLDDRVLRFWSKHRPKLVKNWLVDKLRAQRDEREAVLRQELDLCDKADVNKIIQLRKLGIGTTLEGPKHHWTIAHVAAATGNVELLSLSTASEKVYLNGQDDLGNTPLHYAKNKEIFLELLNHNAILNIKNNEGQTCFEYWAIHNPDLKSNFDADLCKQLESQLRFDIVEHKDLKVEEVEETIEIKKPKETQENILSDKNMPSPCPPAAENMLAYGIISGLLFTGAALVLLAGIGVFGALTGFAGLIALGVGIACIMAGGIVGHMTSADSKNEREAVFEASVNPRLNF